MNKYYFGNFQDFCKYGLLCKLAKWRNDDFAFNLYFGQMKTPDRAPKDASPKNWDYLKDTDNLCLLNERLFEFLRQWDSEGDWLQASHDLLPVQHNNDDMPEDRQERKEFFSRMCDQFSGENGVVFLNPDYGLDFAARLLKGGKTGGDHRSYLMANEIEIFLRQGKSVLFYQEVLLSPEGEKSKDSQRDVLQHLRNAGINERVYFFESRAPSYNGNKATAQSGYFWIVPSRQIPHAGKFYRDFQASEWCNDKINILGGETCFSAARRIGVFIDAENINQREKIVFALDSIGADSKHKTIAPKDKIEYLVAYGKKGKGSSIDNLLKFLQKMGCHTHSVKPGPNEADYRLSCDIGQKIFRSQIDIAVVFSSDDDFCFAARQAHGMCLEYYGIGNEKTANEYRDMCHEFYEIGGYPPDIYLERGRRRNK